MTSMAHHRHPAFFCRSWSIKTMVLVMAPCIATDHHKKLPHGPRHKGSADRFAKAYHEFVDLAIKNDGVPWVFHSYVNFYQRVYPIHIPLNHYKIPSNPIKSHWITIKSVLKSFEPHHQLPRFPRSQRPWHPERAKPGYHPCAAPACHHRTSAGHHHRPGFGCQVVRVDGIYPLVN